MRDAPEKKANGTLAIVGATASGKSALALVLARELGDVELVSVDAMAVYRGFDIGTAKPTKSEQAAVTWHLIDLVDPHEEFSVAAFQELAAGTLSGIAGRGRRAVLVGGSGLYHRAVLDQLEIPPRDEVLAAKLYAKASHRGGLSALYHELEELDPLAASRIDKNNARRVVRALEVTKGTGRAFSSYGPGLSHYRVGAPMQLGLHLSRPLLEARIDARLEAQMQGGFLEEVAAIDEAARHRPLSRTAGKALGYRELLSHLHGEVGLDEALELIRSRTKRYARRQEAWFRRDPRVHWLEADADDLAERALGEVRSARDDVGR